MKDWPVLTALTVIVLLIGGCVVDLASSSRRGVNAVIFDKEHVPGHYVTNCDRCSCDNHWIGPTWALVYYDGEGQYQADVGEGIYYTAQVGQKIFVSFREGGMTGIRYASNVQLKTPAVEKY